MSHVIELPDDVYRALEDYAAEQGKPVDELAADLLARDIAQASALMTSGRGRLDWSTATAEEIIAALRASRVERERPIEL
jgi:hypothetical protein